MFVDETSTPPFLTEENHFKFGYDYRWYQTRCDASERFTVAFGSARRPVNDWRSECIEAARKIGETAEAPIEMLLSGGIDSEVAALSLLAAGVPFTAHTLRFADDLNLHDIAYAIRFCADCEVPHKLHDIDILKFFERDLYHYAALAQSVSPQLCATMWLVDQLDGYPVFGQGEPLLVRRPSGHWAFRESEKINAWYRYFIRVGRSGVPGFHQYTPEQMLSFLTEFIEHPMLAVDSGKQSSLTSKFAMYSKHFPLEWREKYTGYEQIMDYDAIHRHRLSQLYPHHGDACHIDFAYLLHQLALTPISARGHITRE